MLSSILGYYVCYASTEAPEEVPDNRGRDVYYKSVFKTFGNCTWQKKKQPYAFKFTCREVEVGATKGKETSL